MPAVLANHAMSIISRTRPFEGTPLSFVPALLVHGFSVGLMPTAVRKVLPSLSQFNFLLKRAFFATCGKGRGGGVMVVHLKPMRAACSRFHSAPACPTDCLRYIWMPDNLCIRPMQNSPKRADASRCVFSIDDVLRTLMLGRKHNINMRCVH